MAEIIQIDSNTWRIEDGFVRFFLLEGEERAALIDSGVNCPNAFDIAKELTGKPLILLNTHGDGDHTSGTDGFTNIHIHPLDYVECDVKNRYPNTSMIPLNDGDIISLGNRSLKIIHIPGHTKGSVAFLDMANRVLYAGDSVQKGHIYMFGKKRCPELFEKSLDKLIAMKSEYDCIYASHDSFMLSRDYVENVKMAWKQVQSGEIAYEMIDLYGNLVKSFTTPVCGFYMEQLWQSEELICYDVINPTQYIFHEDTEMCTPVYTKYHEDYEKFYEEAIKDIEPYVWEKRNEKKFN